VCCGTALVHHSIAHLVEVDHGAVVLVLGEMEVAHTNLHAQEESATLLRHRLAVHAHAQPPVGVYPRSG
jgi:hypothetical protein